MPVAASGDGRSLRIVRLLSRAEGAFHQARLIPKLQASRTRRRSGGRRAMCSGHGCPEGSVECSRTRWVPVNFGKVAHGKGPVKSHSRIHKGIPFDSAFEPPLARISCCGLTFERHEMRSMTAPVLRNRRVESSALPRASAAGAMVLVPGGE